ncbi:MAG: NAD-dependent epimerase/dehydratase family protein [Polyangiales bacterium]
MVEAAHPTSKTESSSVLVTGASGHLGANLVRRLLDEGQAVRVLLRQGSNNSGVDGLDVERIFGDLRDPASVRRAVQGCRRIYHTAALVSTQYGTAQLKRDIFDSNVMGTQHLLNAARREGVERVVVTGSFSATGYNLDNPSEPAQESQPVYPFHRSMPYELSKAFVEQEALKAYADGLDVVIATSCAILGPNDFKPSRMGKTLCAFAHGKLPAYVPGGFEFVAAQDIVQGHRLAMDKGRSGQKYVIATRYTTVDELMDFFALVTGRRKPLLRLPPTLMQAVAELSAPIVDRIPGADPRLTPGAIRILRLQRRADTRKARDELGFRPTRLLDAIQLAYEDFVRRGVLPRSAQVSVPESAPQPAADKAETSPDGAGVIDLQSHRKAPVAPAH